METERQAARPCAGHPGAGRDYVLGHSDDELRRLAGQSRFFGELTAQVLGAAGVGRGMRVLDAGCGAGDVSFLAAELVGSTGVVVGVDKSAGAVAAARKRASAAGLRNVAFIEGDICDLTPGHPFDAVVGRLVLMHQPDPAAALGHLAGHVRPGGLIIFQEMDISGAKSLPEAPLFEQTARCVAETLRRAGAETRMGLKLYRTFAAAGLPAPRMLMGARVEGGPDSYAYELLAETARTLLPLMERFGVATPEQISIETLAARLRREVVRGGGVIVVPPLVGAWARKPR
ncbi:MAG TPA: methyltransferase domain-containing protein [Pyrinomonadaceae bacterium]|nr:methyltransferase domain-containing protein [Pyrinomonadaceae bacterium]